MTTADGMQSGFTDPFAALWMSVAARLSGQHPADLPTSVDLALRVEALALALAELADQPHARTWKDA
ncbi:hypothetical protein [Streptomyces cupreus]|uniref:Uncharacterized protein n=1 Tax=Streptomyces cupreus TaxID=2759956 RepID=A0A7X1J9R0_9ACTN|nr:hypothetical protein [Streptomyces cupreus]MBC2906750.1 hypothetical protein [Streptomyces cupreus]